MYMSRRSALCVRLFVDRLAQSGMTDKEKEETHENGGEISAITRENELNDKY